MAKSSMPVRVRVPGTEYSVWREKEGEGKCSQCRKSRNSLFSYDDEGRKFCNVRHWMTYVVLQFGIGGGRLEDESGKRPRGHKRRHLASVAS